MKNSSREDLNIILKKICTANYGRQDIKLLLLEIRDYLDTDSSLRDIANCIHPIRNKGGAFRKIKSHVENFLSVAKDAGKLIVIPIYEPSKLITELVNCLNDLNFVFDKEIFRKQLPNIIKFICEFMDGTKIDLKNSAVKDCRLSHTTDNKGQAIFCFCFNFCSPIIGALRVPINVTIAMPFFEMSEITPTTPSLRCDE